MTTSDIDQALRVLNIEPLYGHSPHNPPSFRRALPYAQATAAGTVYFVEDEEIDFDRVLREEKIPLPKPANWTAHWLAVEGVQPLIPENPPAIPRDTEPDVATAKLTTPPRPGTQYPPTPPSPSRHAGNFASKRPNQLLVKQVLSRELMLYYTRLTTTLIPPQDDTKRAAALSSLRNDAGLQTLLPYLVKWVGDGVVNVLREPVQTESDGRVLGVLLDVIGALLDNNTLFIEPYVSTSSQIQVFSTNSFTVAPTAAAFTVYFTSFLSPCLSFYPSPNNSVPDPLTSPHATFNNIPITFAAHNEDITCRTYLTREKQGYEGRCCERTDWSREGSRSQRPN